MRVCRFCYDKEEQAGFYFEEGVVPLGVAADAYAEQQQETGLAAVTGLLALLPNGAQADAAHAVAAWLEGAPDLRGELALGMDEVELLAPVASPRKILLLAGNYAAHIEEEGKIALERAETFPYLFSKPPTTVNHPNAPVPLPRVSPDHIDYECELGVVIGKAGKHLREADALGHVAGYTVVNDISDRKYKPFPERKPRERDAFFDWQHGKWHDGFCPMCPCVTSARTLAPDRLRVTLRVNGETRQDGTTAQMIFPVAAIIEFISRSLTLEPGDVIATGTPAGVGMTTNTFLRPGDTLDAEVEGIGVLHNVMAEEG